MKQKLKILIFIDWYIPAFKAGGPIRSIVNLVTRFSDQFDFFVICSDKDLGDVDSHKSIHVNEWNKGEFGEQIFYVSKDNSNRKFLHQLIKETDFDRAYINGVFSWFFSIIPILVLRKYTQKTIIAPRGMLHSSALAVKNFKKKIFLGILKAFSLLKPFVLQAMDDLEKKEIQKNLGDNYVIKLAPNIPAKPLKNLELNIKESKTLKLFCLSRISPEKNIDLAIDILHSCDFPVEFDIYGDAINDQYLEEVKSKITELPKHINVHLKGSINPKDIKNVIAEHHVFFLPTAGENFGHAIYESLAHGCPVLISDQTPWQNLADKNVGFDVSLENRAKFLGKLKLFYDMDNRAYKEMRLSSLDFATQVFEDKTLEEAYLELFK